MAQNPVTLDRLSYGDGFEIISLHGQGEIKKRLLDMGLIPGAKGIRLHQGLLRDPIELRLGAFKVSLRHREAKNILVLPLVSVPDSIDQRGKNDFAPKQDLQAQQLPRQGRGRRFRHFFDPMHQHYQRNRRNHATHRQPTKSPKDPNVIRIAMAGNPNTGKSSLYNLITGSHAHVGNYSGVTVETKKILFRFKGYTFEFIDLPGIYSLSAYSFEEVVSRDFILMEKPDVVLDVLDSTNLERNLYLLLQFRELGVPIVGALNMSDEAQAKNIHINEELLSRLLEIPLIKTSAVKKIGIDALLDQLLETALQQRQMRQQTANTDMTAALSEPMGRHLNYGAALEKVHDQLIDLLAEDSSFSAKYSLHWISIKLLEDDFDAKWKVEQEHTQGGQTLRLAKELRDRLAKEYGMDAQTLVAQQRYGFIRGALKEALVEPENKQFQSITERLDRFALHPVGGIAFFFIIMYLIYSLTFALGNPVSDLIDTFFAYLGNLVHSSMNPGILRDFIADGVIAGVGGVLVFLPIIVFLFAGLSFLEDSGYMARAAFVMDKIMHKFGLHGRSFIPMMIGTGCAVPAVMATRTLANPKDRIITSMVLPMMMCSAKTPVIAMLTAAFFASYAGLVFWFVWLAAWIIALLSSLLLSKTLFKGEVTAFVMELPPYRRPTVWGIVKHMWEKAMGYIKKAGTIILAASILTWIAFNFPKNDNLEQKFSLQKQTLISQMNKDGLSQSEKKALKQKLQKMTTMQKQEEFNHSWGGRTGKAMEPFFALLGFDWKMSVSLLAALPAKEIVISTMAVVYGIDQADGEDSVSLKKTLQQDRNYSPLAVFSFIIFLLIYTPCFATLAVIKRELDGWRWVFLSFFFSFGTAFALSFGIFQIGSLFLNL